MLAFHRHNRLAHILLIVLLVVVLGIAFLAGARAYRALLLLDSAQSSGMAETSSIRAWMTLSYVASSYGVTTNELRRELNLAPDIPDNATLWAIAEAKSLRPFTYLVHVQGAIARISARSLPEAAPADEPGSWLDRLSDTFLSAILVYSMIGRILWTGVYFGLGYAVGTDFEVASSFLGWMSVSLVAAAVATGAGFLPYRGRRMVETDTTK